MPLPPLTVPRRLQSSKMRAVVFFTLSQGFDLKQRKSLTFPDSPCGDVPVRLMLRGANSQDAAGGREGGTQEVSALKPPESLGS